MAKKSKIINNMLEIDSRTLSTIFKKIKDKGILDKPQIFLLCGLPNISLLNSEHFMDKIHYYRLLKNVSKRKLSIEVGIDDQTYEDYENKYNQLSNPFLAERFIKALKIENDLELPDYYKFMKEYPYEKVIKYIKENYSSAIEFSNLTGIKLGTIRNWLSSKKEVNISLKSYKKLYKYLKNVQAIFHYN